MLFYDDLAAYISGEQEKLQRLAQANIPTTGVILEVLGPSNNQDIASNPNNHSVTQAVDQLVIDSCGIAGDRHRGWARPATGREAPLYKKTKVPIANRRQLFAVSPYECHLLSRKLEVEITPQLLGANLVIGNADGTDFCISEVPSNTYFVIDHSDACKPSSPPIATLIQYVQQKGCSRTGHAIATTHQDPTLTKRFVTNAEHRRGILCSVEYPVDQPTVLERGQKVFLRFPMGSCY